MLWGKEETTYNRNDFKVMWKEAAHQITLTAGDICRPLQRDPRERALPALPPTNNATLGIVN